MGREALARVSWQGQSGETKLLLESSELILRGEIKARIARDTIVEARADAEGLRLSVEGTPLLAALPEAEAARWVKAIQTPPPSLASKLGIGPDKPALVLGAIADAALAKALDSATTDNAGAATLIVAIVEDEASLDAALQTATTKRLALWCVYPKGKAAQPGDSAIRSRLRGAGMMDSKTSTVSERLTATRYGWPKS